MALRLDVAATHSGSSVSDFGKTASNSPVSARSNRSNGGSKSPMSGRSASKLGGKGDTEDDDNQPDSDIEFKDDAPKNGFELDPEGEPLPAAELNLSSLIPKGWRDVVAYSPKPLHVRGLVRAAKRRVRRDMMNHAKNLKELQKEVEKLKKSDNPELYKTKREHLHKAYYIGRILKARKARLEALCPHTFKEFPQRVFEAARDGDAEFIRLGVEANVDVNTPDPYGISPLIAAVVAGKESVVRALLESNADPTFRDLNGATCVHYAVQLDQLHMLNTLLKDIPARQLYVLNIRDARGLTAMDYAKQPDKGPFRELLKSKLGGPVSVFATIYAGRLYPPGENTPRQTAAAKKRPTILVGFLDFLCCGMIDFAPKPEPIKASIYDEIDAMVDIGSTTDENVTSSEDNDYEARLALMKRPTLSSMGDGEEEEEHSDDDDYGPQEGHGSSEDE